MDDRDAVADFLAFYAATFRLVARQLAPEHLREEQGHYHDPADAGDVLARNQLLLAAREAESGEADAEKGEGGRLRNAIRGLRVVVTARR
jgi:hypothetical protein